MEGIIVGIALSVIGLWLGGIEVRMRNLDSRLRDAPSRKEVSSEIDLRMEAVRVMQQEIKEDIKEMRRSLEKLIEHK